MTKEIDQRINAGVHANIGMSFQKNCTIYLFLEKYHEIKNQRYFILLEHLDDIVFGYLESNTHNLSKVETYQAKKSSNKWTLGGILEIIKQITTACEQILNDPLAKSDSFNQENYFATNNTIELKAKIKGETHSCIINESREEGRYIDLHEGIQQKIQKGNNQVQFSDADFSNFDSLCFKFVDLGRKTQSQLDHLVGKFASVFEQNIHDHKAALFTFYYALQKIENELNQNNTTHLSDNKKRIESHEIESLIGVLTKKKLAYDFWRDKGESICDTLNISLLDSNTFKLHFENSFDKFKDVHESEHKKVYSFVEHNKAIFHNHTRDESCIADFFDSFKKEKSTTFLDLQLKAAVSAAYIEIKSAL